MTRTAKIVIAAAGILVFLIVFILLKNPFSPSSISTADYTIKNGHVSGTLTASSFEIIFDAEITADEEAQVSVGRGRRIDYISNRAEILENIFGNIEGINSISSLADLEEYVQLQMDNKMDYSFDITPEDLAYSEIYTIGSFPQEGSKEFRIEHRDNEIYYLEVTEPSPQEKMEMAGKFARDLLLDTSYFNFAEPIVSEKHRFFFPVEIDGLPVEAVSFDVYYDRDLEHYVLMNFDEAAFPGIRIGCTTSDEGITATTIHSDNAVLPYEISTEKRPIISVAEAMDALKDNLDTLYIEGRLPEIHTRSERDFIITEISLAYAAIYDDNGEYDLEPIYVFTPDFNPQEDLSWEMYLHVNALTGEVYPVIASNYYWTLNKLK